MEFCRSILYSSHLFLSRQEMMAAQKEGGKKSSGPAMDARKEMSKTKEQVDLRLSINSDPLAPRWRRR